MRYGVVAFAVILALFFRAFLVSVYKVPTQTMAPTIVAGDYLFASQTSYGFKFPWSKEIYFTNSPVRGDLVVFSKDSRIYIKRVIAVGGDTVSTSQGIMTVNAESCKQEFVQNTDNENFAQYKEICGGSEWQIIRQADSEKIPALSQIKLDPGHLFVSGDYRDFESNPNYAELISIDQIISKPVLIWMSYASTQDFISKDTGVRWNRILTKPK